jgi:hypothetical protein
VVGAKGIVKGDLGVLGGICDSAEGTKSDCGMRNQSLDVRSTTLLVRQYVGSRCA